MAEGLRNLEFLTHVVGNQEPSWPQLALVIDKCLTQPREGLRVIRIYIARSSSSDTGTNSLPPRGTN
jgi:hypothetical protein